MHKPSLSVRFDEIAIDAILNEYDSSRIPGVAVGISIGGTPVYRKAFGVASAELPVALSPSIRMRIGSITKQFTCLAFLLLCEDGLASLADPIGKHVPELRHSPIRDICVRHLMTHTSGLRDVCDLRLRFGGYGGTRTSSQDLLHSYRAIQDVNGSPDVDWIYNNGAYVLLTLIIERIAGRPLESVLEERIFSPMSMHDTMVRRWDSEAVSNSARSHTALSAGHYDTSTWELDFAGAGAMVSTVDDMLRWLAHIDSPHVGTAETWRMLTMPQFLKNGASTGYGFGVAVSKYRGLVTLSHIGGWTGANAQVIKAPQCSLDVVVMSNRSDLFAPLVVNRLIDACVAGLEPIAESPSDSPIVGEYVSRTTGRLVELFSKDGQQVVAIDGHELPYVIGADLVMRPAAAWRHIKRTIRLAENRGARTPMLLDDFGHLEELYPLRPPTEGEPVRICGVFRSEQTHTTAEIVTDVSVVAARLSGAFGTTSYSLRHVGDQFWRASPLGSRAGPIGAALSFDDDHGGFRFSTAATRSLPFRRVE